MKAELDLAEPLFAFPTAKERAAVLCRGHGDRKVHVLVSLFLCLGYATLVGICLVRCADSGLGSRQHRMLPEPITAIATRPLAGSPGIRQLPSVARPASAMARMARHIVTRMAIMPEGPDRFKRKKDLPPWLKQKEQDQWEMRRERRRPAVEDGYLTEFLMSKDDVQIPRIVYQGRTPESVLEAVRIGYWGFDFNAFKNKVNPLLPATLDLPTMAAALATALKSGAVSRDGLFIQVHVNATEAAEENPDLPIAEQMGKAITKLISGLGLEYIDSLVLNGLYMNSSFDETMEAWRAMEDAQQAKLTRQLGASSVQSLELLQQVYDNATIKPAVIQHRHYKKPREFDIALRAFCAEENIVYQQFWSIPKSKFNNERMQALAQVKYGVSPQALVFRWQMGKGIIPLTGTQDERVLVELYESQNIAMTKADAEFLDELLIETGDSVRGQRFR